MDAPPKICHPRTQATSDGFWNEGDPLRRTLPLFMIQICLMMALTRILQYLLRPLKQPRVVAEVIAGIILGPSVLGRNQLWRDTVFPEQGENLLRTTAIYGMVFFLFLIGLKIDPVSIIRSAKRPMAIAVIGLCIPLVVVTALAASVVTSIPAEIAKGPFFVFIPSSLTITAFPNLGLMLAELDLLNSELGQIAMSSALVNDMFGYFFMALFVAVDQGKDKPLNGLFSVGSLVMLILFFVFVFRPWATWVNKSTPKGCRTGEGYILIVLLGTLLSAFVSDFIGATIIDGPFIMGLAMPDGPPFAAELIEKSDMLVMEVFLPLLYVMSGMSTDLSVVADFSTWSYLFLVMVVGYVSKFVGTLVCGIYLDMYIGNAVILAFLMSFRGIIEVLTFHNWLSHGLLDNKAFTVMVLSTLANTAIAVPVVSTFYKQDNQSSSMAGHTISRTRPEAELRVLVCVHTPEAVPNLINLLDSIHTAPGIAPMCVYVLNMVELVGSSFPLLVANTETKEGGFNDPVLNAFAQYEYRMASAVVVQPYTTVSPYRTMHQDVCRLAEDKHVALIVIPYRRKEAEEELMSKADQALRTMTPVVQAASPCSVGMLVHNGRVETDVPHSTHLMNRVGLIFWGGKDDREALALAWRMVDNPNVTLTLSRFVRRVVEREDEKERRMDDMVVEEFTTRYGRNKNVAVSEFVVDDAVQAFKAVKAIGRSYDLLIVGRQPNLSEGLTEFIECPELGPLGDMFASMDVEVKCSVLVVQQYS